MALHAQRVAVIIPAWNEAQTIAIALQNVPSWVDTVVVVNNGSTDAAVARSFGATVVEEPTSGYGAACQKALEVLAPLPPDIVVVLDAEFFYNANDILKITEPVSLGMYDVVLGTRSHNPQATKRNTGSAFGLRLLRYFWDATFTDICSIRALRWSTFERLNIGSTSWGWNVEMQISIVRKGLRFLEVPIESQKRSAMHTHSGQPVVDNNSQIATIATIVRLASLPALAICCTLLLFSLVLGVVFSSNQSSTAPFILLACTIVWGILTLCIRKSLFAPRVRKTIMYTALIMHCFAATAWGVLSADIHRYMWDGHILRNHVSPYIYTPSSSELQPLHTNQLPQALAQPNSQALSPPVAQAWFSVSSFIGTSWWGWKIPTLLCVLGSCVALFRLIRIRQGAATNILMYATAPLLLFNGTIDAHVHIIMLFYLLSALVLLEGKQPWWGYIFCGALLGMAIGTNITPLFLLPWVVRGKSNAAIAYILGGALLAVTISYLPFLGTDIISPYANYLLSVSENSLLHTLLHSTVPNITIQFLRIGLFLFFAGIIWFRIRDKYRSMSFIMVLFALCSPVIHPWHLLPLLAFTAIAFSWSSFTLLCTISLTALFATTQKNSGMSFEHSAIVYIVFIPVLLLFITELYTSGLTALQLRTLRHGRATGLK